MSQSESEEKLLTQLSPESKDSTPPKLNENETEPLKSEVKGSKTEKKEDKLSTKVKPDGRIPTSIGSRQRQPIPTLNKTCQLVINNAITPGGTLDFKITYGPDNGSHEIAYPASTYPSFSLNGTDLDCYNNSINPNADPIDVEFV